MKVHIIILLLYDQALKIVMGIVGDIIIMLLVMMVMLLVEKLHQNFENGKNVNQIRGIIR
jgi:hypothetical protein